MRVVSALQHLGALLDFDVGAFGHLSQIVVRLLVTPLVDVIFQICITEVFSFVHQRCVVFEGVVQCAQLLDLVV